MAKEGSLTRRQAEGRRGCGFTTRNSCYALTIGTNGYECLEQTDPNVAYTVGLRKAWRTNIDTRDGKAWCPLGLLPNSKCR